MTDSPHPATAPEAIGQRQTTPAVANLLAAAALGAPEALEALRARAENPAVPDEPEPAAAAEHLLFLVGRMPCAVRLSALREVLVEVPHAVTLPDSPPWLLGVFPLHAEIVGLVDPLPVLTGRASSAHDAALAPAQARTPGVPPARMALVAGEGECLVALLVDGIGQIALVRDEAVTPLATLDAAAARALPFAPRYVAGMYAAAREETPYLVIALPALLEDMLCALETEEARHHE